MIKTKDDFRDQYRCKHFKIQELVTPARYNKYGDRCWQFLNPQLLQVIDLLREDFGSCVINDWLWGGRFEESGFRSFDYNDDVLNTSLHKLGMAFDLKFRNFNAYEVRRKILANPDRYYMIKGIEINISWVHIDIRNVDTNSKFFTFKP